MVRDEARRVLPSGSKEGIMSEKLKPCPFCGGYAEVLPCAVVFESVEYWFVKCSECEARSCVDEKWAVVEAWNRRANEEEER